jgi:hypothetical protein
MPPRQFSSLLQRRFIAATGADLMQLDDVAEGVSYKDLIGILADQALNPPVPDATLVQFLLGLLDILYSQRHMRNGGIFGVAARHRRSSHCTHQMDLGGMGVVAHVHPKARDPRNIGPSCIHRQSQHLAIKLPGLFSSSAVLPMRMPWWWSSNTFIGMNLSSRCEPSSPV